MHSRMEEKQKLRESGAFGSQSQPHSQTPSSRNGVGAGQRAGGYPASHSPKAAEMQALALSLSKQTVERSQDEQWGILTALSGTARDRSQGDSILLFRGEHVLGRTVPEAPCKFDALSISGQHCRISWDTDQSSALVKDSSSNGTFINGVRVPKGQTRLLKHGDILSLVGGPTADAAFVFVYRAIPNTVPPAPPLSAPDSQPAALKRKVPPPVPPGSDGKRQKNQEGPVRLDDVKRLQKSNEDLRVQLEEQLQLVEKLQAEQKAVEIRHQDALKDARASAESESKAKVTSLATEVSHRNSEIEGLKAAAAAQQSKEQDLQKRLETLEKSRRDAEEAIKSHMGTIAGFEKRLEAERQAHEEGKNNLEAAQAAALQKLRAEAAEDLNRRLEGADKVQHELNARIAALQEADKEHRAQQETLRARLDAERQIQLAAEEQARRAQAMAEGHQAAVLEVNKRIEDLEAKLSVAESACKRKDEECRRAEEQTAELKEEVSKAQKEVQLEQRRTQGLREKVLVQQTQMRAFYSESEEIRKLQDRQKERLAVMMSAIALESQPAKPSGETLRGPNQEHNDTDKERNPMENATQMEEDYNPNQTQILPKPDQVFSPEKRPSDHETEGEEENSPKGTGTSSPSPKRRRVDRESSIGVYNPTQLVNKEGLGLIMDAECTQLEEDGLFRGSRTPLAKRVILHDCQEPETEEDLKASEEALPAGGTSKASAHATLLLTERQETLAVPGIQEPECSREKSPDTDSCGDNEPKDRQSIPETAPPDEDEPSLEPRARPTEAQGPDNANSQVLECAENMTDSAPVEPTPQAAPPLTEAPPAPKLRERKKLTKRGGKASRFRPSVQQQMLELNEVMDVLAPGAGQRFGSPEAQGQGDFETTQEDADSEEEEEESASEAGDEHEEEINEAKHEGLQQKPSEEGGNDRLKKVEKLTNSQQHAELREEQAGIGVNRQVSQPASPPSTVSVP